MNTPYLACSSCGIRKHGNYDEIDVATLPDFFKFKAKDQVMFDVLKGGISLCCLLSQTNTKIEPFAEGVFLMDESGVLNKTATDLSLIKSSFLSENGTRYHLHPELIKFCKTTEMCCLCVSCLRIVDVEIAIGSINLNLPGAEVKLAKRDLSRQKSEKKTCPLQQALTTVSYLDFKTWRALQFWNASSLRHIVHIILL